ncbi:unnamed protein product [Phytophthora lilii]|uniref:Unnamed protein product n=1 Tax=Phytophthora lilii TaxID=2077276 RepID=A0A9W6WU76_9STRA|nr:unnamed protein product [Phytophthora lilii]
MQKANEALTEEKDGEVFSVGIEGTQRRKSLLTSKSNGSPTKVYTGLDSSQGASLEKKSSKYAKAHAQANATRKKRHKLKVVALPGVIAVVVFTCLCWTLWLILLNVVPNDSKTNHLFYAVVQKLLMKFGDLALETFLLYQMLESGSPAVLVAVFTVVVASNALICAAMMFVPYERATLAETIIDILCVREIQYISNFITDRSNNNGLLGILKSKFSSPLTVLPDDMFDDMTSLTFIHFVFMSMTKLPSFQGLTNLKSITLACFFAMEELPAFDSLENLERLVLSSMPALDSLPELSPVSDLKSFAVSDRGAWCCKGFIGDCKPGRQEMRHHSSSVGKSAGVLPASNRTEKVASTTTLKLIEKFSSTICGPVLEAGVLEGPPTEELMAPCNGTLHRQCPRSDNIESMCYNARFMAIACTTNPYPIEMRRCKIAQGVGDSCDPEIEAWLGCK